MRVRDVMTTTVVTASPDTPFPELVDQLLHHGVSGLPVVDADHKLVGIVTEADLVPKEAYGGRRRRALEVVADFMAGGESRWAIKAKGQVASELMTRDVVTVEPKEDLRAAARRIVETGVKRLPVVDADGRLVGIVSRTDLLRVLHRSDDDIRGDLERMLSDPLWAPDGLDLQITVADGVVTLAGTTRFPLDLPVVTSMAWRVPGVVEVCNEATGREPDPRVVPA